jgi:hypothetical protein
MIFGNKQPKLDSAGEERIKSWLLEHTELILQAVGVTMGGVAKH